MKFPRVSQPAARPAPPRRQRALARLLGASLLGALLAACTQHGTPPTAQEQARAQQMRPADPALASAYERSCMLCHAQADSGAPLTGAASAWAPRLRQGMDTLLARTENGFNAMPARGQCADCSAQDLRALIAFMAQNTAP